MKTMAMLCVLLAATMPARAEDWSFAFEGNEQKRVHLKDLQGVSTPPALYLADWTNSEPLTMEGLKGKIVVLDFWATWCGPCIRSIPHTNALRRKYSKDVVFIGVWPTPFEFLRLLGRRGGEGEAGEIQGARLQRAQRCQT